jgi:hypothetical protein
MPRNMKETGRSYCSPVLVLRAQAFDVLLFDAEDLFDDGVGEELDLRVGDGALEHDLGGAEVFACG